MQFVNEIVVRLMSLRDESGQGMAEYGLILALVAVVAMGAFVALGNGVFGNVNTVAGAL